MTPTTSAAVAQDPIHNLLVSVGALLGPFVEDGEPIKRGEARDLLLRIRQARAALAQPRPSDDSQGGVPVALYVDCCECSDCGHIGINDSHATDSACNFCGWSGPSPKEDHCPECDRRGTMTLACPKCSSRYQTIAETSLAATPAATAQAERWRGPDAAVIAINSALARIRRGDAAAAIEPLERARSVLAAEPLAAAPAQKGAQAISDADIKVAADAMFAADQEFFNIDQWFARGVRFAEEKHGVVAPSAAAERGEG